MKTCQKILSVLPSLNKSTGKVFLVIFFAVALSSCADSTGTINESTAINNGQLPEKVVIFPTGFFDAGYKESYVVTGSDDFGRKYTGSYEVLTGAKDVFNGVDVIPVDSTLSYTTTINGVQTTPITIVLTQYYSATTPRQYIGNVNSNTSLVSTLLGAATDIPSLVTNNSSGQVARLVASDSSIETIDWSVSSNANGDYDLAYSYNDTDSAGGLITNEINTFVVNANGRRLSWTMTSEIPSLSNTLRFSGSRQ